MDVVLEVGLSNGLATAVLAVAALAVSALCRRRPALVHGLWLVVLLKLVTPPLLRVPVSWPEPAAPAGDRAEPVTLEQPVAAEPPAAVVFVEPAAIEPLASGDPPPVQEAGPSLEEMPAEGPASTPAPPWPWRQILGGVWLAGSCGWLLLASWRLWRFRRLLGHALLAPASVQERAARLARRLGLAHAPKVWLLPGRLAPLLWWLGGRPRLLLPAELPGQLCSEGLDTVLVHELAHLRRRDHWVRALELVVMGLYWWHPVVWYARRELREAEEQCCDAWVVTTIPGAGRLYATTLLDTLDFLSHEGPAVPLLASGLGPVTDLKRRLTMILSGSTPRGLGWPGCLTLLAIAVLSLPCLPAWGQDKPTTPPEVPTQDNDPFDPDAARRVRALESKVRNRQEQLQDLQKQLQDLQRKLDAARDLAEATKVEGENRAATDPQAREGKKARSSYVVIIQLEGMEPQHVKKLVGRLHGVLPPSARVEVTQRSPEARTDMIRPGTPAPAYPKAPVSVNPPLIAYPPGTTQLTPMYPPSATKPRPEGVPTGPVPVPPVVTAPTGGADARIERLERQMEKILHRLDQLQKERGGNNPPPPSPAKP